MSSRNGGWVCEPDRRYIAVRDDRVPRRLPDRRTAVGPDARQGRVVGGAGAAADLCLRVAGPQTGRTARRGVSARA